MSEKERGSDGDDPDEQERASDPGDDADDNAADDADDAPTSEPKKASAEAKTPAPPKAPARRFFHRWMLGALLVAAFTGVPAGLWYRSYDAIWQRRPPKLAACFVPLRARLEKPAIVSPSEPFPTPSGETIYLTTSQFQAAACATKLPNKAAFRLAAAFAHADPEAQARALSEVVLASPSGAEGDAEALSLWWLVKPSLQALPESPVREQAVGEVDEFVGCRFEEHPKLPTCSSRPPLPVGILVLGGVGSFALCLILASLLQSTFGRARADTPPVKKS